MDPQTRFSNDPVARDDLPDYRGVPLNAVAPAYLHRAMITHGVFGVVIVAAAFVAPRLPYGSVEPAWWQPLAALALALVAGIYAWLDSRFRRWAVREHDLIYRYGVIWRKTVIVPFARIQHVEAASGPLERWLGLMRVKCFTAGGQTADLTVKGLSQADARRVRQYLLEQIRADGDAGQDDAEDDADRHEPG